MTRLLPGRHPDEIRADSGKWHIPYTWFPSGATKQSRHEPAEILLTAYVSTLVLVTTLCRSTRWNVERAYPIARL